MESASDSTVGDTLKLPGSPDTLQVPLTRGNSLGHRGESRGYGKNPVNRDNGQRRSKGMDALCLFRFVLITKADRADFGRTNMREYS